MIRIKNGIKKITIMCISNQCINAITALSRDNIKSSVRNPCFNSALVHTDDG